MKEFSIGDIVRLKSNPEVPMTVNSIDPLEWQPSMVTREARTVIKCVWLDGNGLVHYCDFDSRVLTNSTFASKGCYNDE